jgi:hypothetical protein
MSLPTAAYEMPNTSLSRQRALNARLQSDVPRRPPWSRVLPARLSARGPGWPWVRLVRDALRRQHRVISSRRPDWCEMSWRAGRGARRGVVASCKAMRLPGELHVTRFSAAAALNALSFARLALLATSSLVAMASTCCMAGRRSARKSLGPDDAH